MKTGRRALLCLALSLASAGCRAADTAAPIDPNAVGAARYPGAEAILSGFDPAEPGADWRVGDRVLFALTTESGTVTRTKLVEIELLGAATPEVKVENHTGTSVRIVESMEMHASLGGRTLNWSSALLRVAVRVYEADGRLVQHTEAKVPETALRGGMHPALEAIPELTERVASAGGAKPVEPSDREMRMFGDAATMLPTLLSILQGDKVLQSLLMQVVGPPPLLSLFKGIHVKTSADLGQSFLATDVDPTPWAPGTRYRQPLQLAVNDTPMLDLQLEIAAADPPLRLCGGIVALRGVARRDAKRTATLELLAARRGPPGAEFQP